MKPITRILVPTDFSAHSSEALTWAIDLAKRYEAALWLLHAYEPTGYMMPGGYVSPGAEVLEAERIAREEKLHSAKARALAAGVGSIETFQIPGPAARGILRVADENDCGLIVMGTHGRTGVQRALLGSVAEHVVRLAKCPVLTARAAD